MSSFICSSKQFNSCEKTLHSMLIGSDFHWPYEITQTFKELDNQNHHTPETQEKKVTEIFDTIRELSALCVCLQYAHHTEGDLDQEIKTQTMILKQYKRQYTDFTKVELYKSLCCIRYQIETEHLENLRKLTPEETNAMLFLNEMINHLAHELVKGLTSYQMAKWSID